MTPDAYTERQKESFIHTTGATLEHTIIKTDEVGTK